MDTVRRFAVVLGLAVSVGAAYGQSASPPTAAVFAERLRGLDPKNDRARRLETLGWIRQHADEKNGALAVAALERCLRDDPESAVRQRAVETLGQLANRLRQPCPLGVVRALLDPLDQVRWRAGAWAAVFKTFAPGSAEVLLRGVKSERPDVRSTTLILLPRAAGKDPKALAAMKKATIDPVFDVRHSAHLALFRARDRLDEHLPYVIRLREDPASVLSPVPADAAAAKQEREQHNLFLLGIAMQLPDWQENRADELAAALMQLLTDKSAVMRRGAANLIAVSLVKADFRPMRKGDLSDLLASPKDGRSPLLPYLDPERVGKGAKGARPELLREKSKAARCLEKLRAQDRLRTLRDNDPDDSVRAAARRALAQWATLREKQR